MATSEIIYAALFCFSIVFALLGGLYVLLRVFTNLVRVIESKAKKA